MKKSALIWLAALVLSVAGVVWLVLVPAKPGELDTFASCVKESRATYYGAFWCPNCKNQEALFGRSARLLPRVECSTPNGRGQLQVCQDAGIKGYPTWEFADGTRESGTLSLEHLSEVTGCLLPKNDD